MNPNMKTLFENALNATKTADYEQLDVLLETHPEIKEGRDSHGETLAKAAIKADYRLFHTHDRSYYPATPRPKEFENSKKTIEVLIKHKANFNIVENPHSQTPLLFFLERADLIVPMHQAGADFNAKDAMGNTRLIKAAKNNETDVIEELLKCDVDVNAVNNEGKHSLHIARSFRAITILIKAGAFVDPNNPDNDGRARGRSIDMNKGDLLKLLYTQREITKNNG